jgi:hypothetical protein
MLSTASLPPSVVQYYHTERTDVDLDVNALKSPRKKKALKSPGRSSVCVRPALWSPVCSSLFGKESSKGLKAG